MNHEVLCPVAVCWARIFDFEGSGKTPRVFPLGMVQPEASLLLFTFPV